MGEGGRRPGEGSLPEAGYSFKRALIRPSGTLYGVFCQDHLCAPSSSLLTDGTNGLSVVIWGNLHDVAKASATALYTVVSKDQTMMQSCASSASSVMVAPIFSAASMPWPSPPQPASVQAD